MMDHQTLQGLAARESLPVGMLADILFGKTVGELEVDRAAYLFYPTMRTTKGRKNFRLLESFRKWAIALVHPHPSRFGKLSEIPEVQVPLAEVLSWYKKNQSSNAFSASAKGFFKILEENQKKIGRVSSSKARREFRRLEIQKRNKLWNKEYLRLRKEHPDKPDNWCAIQISKMQIAQGRSKETIRKNMK